MLESLQPSSSDKHIVFYGDLFFWEGDWLFVIVLLEIWLFVVPRKHFIKIFLSERLGISRNLEEMFPRYWYQKKDHEQLSVWHDDLPSPSRRVFEIVKWNYSHSGPSICHWCYIFVMGFLVLFFRNISIRFINCFLNIFNMEFQVFSGKKIHY